MKAICRQSILLFLLVLSGCLQICANEMPDDAPPGMKMVCDEDTGICYLIEDNENSDGGAILPSANIAIERIITGYQSAEDFGRWLDGDGGDNEDIDNPLRRNFERYGLAGAMILAILLGLALNLTPCVLPMIPVNLAIIGAKTAVGARGLRLGMLYGIGEALAFGIAGALFVIFGGMFGAFTQTAWFNAAVSLIFVALAMAMLDIVHIDFSRFRGTSNGIGKGELGIFLLGSMNALLASACVAPVLIWVLMLSTDIYAKGNFLGLAIPLMLGIGLGLPWPFLGAGIAKLPRPGQWMNTVKIFFAIIILFAASYYGFAAFRAAKPATVANGLTLNEAISISKDSGKKILLDFWGPACKNCDMMDATTFKAPTIVSRLENFIFVRIDSSLPENLTLVKQCEVIGLPTYIIALPKDN